MLQAVHISKQYRGTTALHDVSFSLAPGEIVGYIGPNGAGKSTTVKIVTGLLQPTTGEVLFQGKPIRDDLIGFRRILGYVPEEAHLYTHLSGLEYLQLVGRLRDMAEHVIIERAIRLLDCLGLDSWRHSPIRLYSKGMKQRVLIASALLHDPEVLVFDEPLSGLDVLSARLFRDLLVELARAGKAILYISHVLEVVEKICDRVLIVADGSVRADASPEDLAHMMQLPDLQAIFAKLVPQRDTRLTAQLIVEAIHA